MSESDDRQRWQAMLEDLGLPAEPEPSPVSVVAKGSEPESAPEPKADENPTDEVQVGEAEASVAPREKRGGDRPARGRRRRGSARDKVESATTAGAAEVDAGTAKPVQSVEEEEKSPAGRRRRRRGRRGKVAAAEEPAHSTAIAPENAEIKEATETPEVAPIGARFEEELPALPDHGPSIEEENEESPEELVPAGLADEEDDEELDDLSGWSVPSWADLVAGLYRPSER
jgi:hypothetical protein